VLLSRQGKPYKAEVFGVEHERAISIIVSKHTVSTHNFDNKMKILVIADAH